MGGAGPTITRKRVKVLPPRKDVTKRIEEEVTKEKRAIRIDRIRKESERHMEEVKTKINPFLNDHGPGHVKRVVENVNNVTSVLDEASFSEKEMGRKVNEQDKFLLEAAGRLHDIGRASETAKEHAISSANFVREHKELFDDEEQKEHVAKLCELHNEAGTRKYGTDNLAKLARKGIIDKETAFRASIVRFADALDVGEKRVKTNSQGQPGEEVIDAIKQSSSDEAKQYLHHWLGHKGIRDCDLERRNGKLTTKISLNTQLTGELGSDIAFRIKDMLRDMNSTILQGNYEISLTDDDKSKIREWYKDYNEIFSDETQGVEINFEK